MVKTLSKRLEKIFQSSKPKTKLVSYFVGCYPSPEISFDLIKQAIDNGISVLEIGYCTSEASAEGPIIKKSHDRVIAQKIGLPKSARHPQNLAADPRVNLRDALLMRNIQ